MALHELAGKRAPRSFLVNVPRLPDGKTLNEGIDFGEITKDGRLKRIVGFFGPIKPL